MQRRFRQLLVKRIAAERGVPVEDVRVIDHQSFPCNEWGDVGDVMVSYEPGSPARAVYGFTALGAVQCYMD